MKIISRSSTPLLLGIALMVVSSCASFRPMPTHAGGKRFDEEERVLAATVYHAAGKMDFSSFKKRKVALEVTSLETSGATEETSFPGTILSIPLPLSQYFSVDYWFSSKLNVKAVTTRQDIQYLKSVIEKRLRFDGFQVTSPEDADIYLVVLIDALGTNYDRNDYLLAYNDKLEISCEMTYYAIDAQTQKLITQARGVASTGKYSELTFRPTPWSIRKRKLSDFNETIVPIPQYKQHYFVSTRGLAPVSEIQMQVEGKAPKKKSKKKRNKKRKTPRRIDNSPLPDALDAGSSMGDLLPDLGGLDTGEKPAKDIDTEKLQKYTKWAERRIKKEDLEGAKKMLKRIKKIDPEADVIPQIETGILELEKKQAEGGSEATSSKKEEIKSNGGQSQVEESTSSSTPTKSDQEDKKTTEESKKETPEKKDSPDQSEETTSDKS